MSDFRPSTLCPSTTLIAFSPSRLTSSEASDIYAAVRRGLSRSYHPLLFYPRVYRPLSLNILPPPSSELDQQAWAIMKFPSFTLLHEGVVFFFFIPSSPAREFVDAFFSEHLPALFELAPGGSRCSVPVIRHRAAGAVGLGCLDFNFFGEVETYFLVSLLLVHWPCYRQPW
ncbi:hypothetical protein GALMADRAFT_136269 [Galerina marginata CBS 339.88]|uniref:Uncharacterized protein n=1 Tax=Galerina marginata (strain CBS 339.88) TaxID=685588 RepID=A0A067TMT6_GALM3|nr:hypothetical protein GALMADRAFT_136269 [Galerina marginata CBS 339.88]